MKNNKAYLKVIQSNIIEKRPWYKGGDKIEYKEEYVPVTILGIGATHRSSEAMVRTEYQDVLVRHKDGKTEVVYSTNLFTNPS